MSRPAAHLLAPVIFALGFLGGLPSSGTGQDLASTEPGYTGRGIGLSVAGLDSLSASTLGRALDYMEVEPFELGFEKRYVRDDTFRLGVIDELMNDPLRLPGWQTRTVSSFRNLVPHPDELMRYAGGVIEAAPTGPTTLALNYWPSAPATRAAEVDIDDGVARFLELCEGVARDVERAFAGVAPEEKAEILVTAPAIWGDAEHPGEAVRKGLLHFEFDAASMVDTTIEPGIDTYLDAAARVDRAAITAAGSQFLVALSQFADQALLYASAPSVDRLGPGRSSKVPAGFASVAAGIEGEILGAWESPWGWIVLGGPSDNLYSSRALARIAVLIDPSGDDVYRGRVGSNIRAESATGPGRFVTQPLGAVVDGAGNDFYDSTGRPYAIGGALFGVAAAIDLSGNDVYRGDDGSQGAALFGAAVLYDGAGRDLFEGRNFCQGAGAFGTGLLISQASPEAPPGVELQPDRGHEAGLIKVPGTGAVPVRNDDNDSYTSAIYSQGFASTFGLGLLYDRTGNDLYRAGGHYLHAPLLPNDFQSLSQGFSIGFRPRAAGGVGILLDEEGNDFYDGEVYAQGTSYFYSLGLLFDGAGNDRYLATQYAQGAGVHLSIGSLWDQGGDDHYVSKFGVTQGFAHDLAIGMLLEEGGNDYYVVSDGQGISITNSVALFIDTQGDDFYATPRGGQGRASYRRGFSGIATFLDLEGDDTYRELGRAADGTIWSASNFAVGIDLDRTIEIPGESVPEVVLTAADSLRAVDEIFETAIIWEVGSAREKVRRARKALVAKEMEAVDYVTGGWDEYPEGEPLTAESGLVYRAIRELANAYPDSMTARILPRLYDENRVVQGNVIRLLGDMKRADAREPLEQMLGDREQDRLWIGIIYALGRIGDRDAAPALRPFLRDAEERRRLYSIDALKALKDTVSIPAFVSLLDDPQFTVRSAALSATATFGAESVSPLVEILGRDTPARYSEDSRFPAPVLKHRAVQVRTLGQIGEALADKESERDLRARALVRRTLMAELDRYAESSESRNDLASNAGERAPTPEQVRASAALARARAVSSLIRLKDPQTLEFVRLHMTDEADPLVRRTYEWEIEQLD